MNNDQPELQLEVVKEEKSNHEKIMDLLAILMVKVDERIKAKKSS